MRREIVFCFRGFILLFALLVTFFGSAPLGFCFPEEFVDACGTSVVIKAPPSRVVSLVPTITEIIFSIGAGDAVGAITYHSTYPSETAGKPVVGGFFSPSLDAIEAIQPDLIFLSSLHRGIRERFDGRCSLPLTQKVSMIFTEILICWAKYSIKKRRPKNLKSRSRHGFNSLPGKWLKYPPQKRRGLFGSWVVTG